MTVVQPNSIAGINSITALDDKITFHKSDGSSIGLTFNNTNFSNTTGVSTFANINITGAASTISANGNATFSGIVTAANFVGDGTAKFGGIQVNTDAQRLRLKGTGSAGAVESIALQLNTNAEGATTQHALLADQNSSVKIYNSGNEKLRTTGFGVTIFGTTRTQTLNVSGVSTSGGNVTISSGVIDLKNSGSVSNIKFYCESSNLHYTQLQSAAHSAYSGNVTITLPTTTDTLVARTTTDTLTNKTLSAPSITGDVDIADKIVHTGDTNTAIRFPAADTFTVETSGSEALRVNSDGELLVNHDSSDGGGKIQAFADNQDGVDILSYSTTDTHGGRLTFYRSKNATVGSNTEVADGDSLGRIDWRGYNDDGTAYNQGARIEAFVSGDVDSSTDMPTDLVFKTSANGSSTPSEHLRITSAGDIGIGTDAASCILDVTDNSSSGYIAEFRQVHASNSGQIVVDSPTDNNIRPSYIDLAQAGTVKWSIGQVYQSTSSQAFHICSGSNSQSNSKLVVTTAGKIGIATDNPSSTLDVRGGLSVGHGIIQERAFFETGGSPSGTFNINVLTNGMVYRTDANMAGTFTINLRGDGSTTFNSLMSVGATAVYTFYAGSNNTSYVLQNFQIDGSNITEKWNGGSAPSAATGSGTDVYTFNIMKTADATFTVFATFSNFA